MSFASRTIEGKAWSAGGCVECGSNTLVTPLHGERGGPLFCAMCAGEWNARQTRIRRAGRVVIGALKAFFEAGGRVAAVDELKQAAFLGLPVLGYRDNVDPAPTLTAETLADALQLVHPDRHAPEHRQRAQHVTQHLLALRPFTFPAPKPPPSPPQKPVPPARDASANDRRRTLEEALREASLKADSFPCRECAHTVPYYYCTPCREEWDRRRAEERKRVNARQRRRYARRKVRRSWQTISCAACGEVFEPRRKDARYCSAACRQKAHRRRVTGPSTRSGVDLQSRDSEIGPSPGAAS